MLWTPSPRLAGKVTAAVPAGFAHEVKSSQTVRGLREQMLDPGNTLFSSRKKCA
jgi:hypothetical protein